MASIDATQRRRAHRMLIAQAKARKAAAKHRRAAEPKGDEREQIERERAWRLCEKHFRDPVDKSRVLPPSPVCLQYAYWQLRGCGWDVCSVHYRERIGEGHCEPGECRAWIWWCGLHFKQRAMIRGIIKSKAD